MNDEAVAAGLFDAHDLIVDFVGKRQCMLSSFHRQQLKAYIAAGIIFALALLCSGQTASVTATLSGQIVSEGFIQWSISVRV